MRAALPLSVLAVLLSGFTPEDEALEPATIPGAAPAAEAPSAAEEPPPAPALAVPSRVHTPPLASARPLSTADDLLARAHRDGAR